jgi:hypothetical protein
MSELNLLTLLSNNTLVICVTVVIVAALMCGTNLILNFYAGGKITTLPFDRLKPFAYCSNFINTRGVSSQIASVLKSLVNKTRSDE